MLSGGLFSLSERKWKLAKYFYEVASIQHGIYSTARTLFNFLAKLLKLLCQLYYF